MEQHDPCVCVRVCVRVYKTYILSFDEDKKNTF